MTRLLFFVLLLIPCSFLAAQDIQRTTRVVDHNEGGTDQKDPPHPNSNKNTLLIDKNNTTDPQFKGQLKYNTAFNISSLLNSYPIVSFSTENKDAVSPLTIPVAEIKIVDARFDNEKVGFLPIGNDMQKRGYNTVGLQINKDLTSWLTEAFINKNIITDSSSKRHLVLVIKKFWFSNAAVDHYSVSNPKMLTSLHYAIDVFTSLELGYYPQKKISGSFTTLYNKANAYSQLTDSILSLLNKELLSVNFAAKETETNWESPVDFNDYYNTRIRKASHFEKMLKGVYASYADFINKTPICDSVEMIVKYTNYQRVPLYACQLDAFKEGQHMPSNKSWGYFDGSSLFVNTGNGFYIKLIRSKNDYVFFDLKSIRQDQIKSSILEGIQIGGTPYQLLKDYTKAYALTYQLDMDTGKLY